MGNKYFWSDLNQGSPTSGPWTGISCQISGSIRLEIKCAISVRRSNYPKTIPPFPVLEKTVFHEICPWCEKGLGLLT